MLTQIEQEYAKHEPDLIQDIYNNQVLKTLMNSINYSKIVSSYDDCIVGGIRADVGLDRKYSFEYVNGCLTCMNIADIFSKMIRSKKRDVYLANLEYFKTHLKEDHGKEL